MSAHINELDELTGDWSTEDALAESREFSGGEFWKPQPGTNQIRYLPPPRGGRPFIATWQHYVDLGGKSISFNCPNRLNGEDCPACMMFEKLRSSASTADRNMANKIRAKRRVYAWVIDRKNEAQGPQIFAFGATIHSALLDMRSKMGVDLTNIRTGQDVVILKKGEKMDTEYTVMLNPRGPSPLAASEEQMIEWLRQRDYAKLEKFAVVLDWDTLSAKLEDAKGVGDGGGSGRRQLREGRRSAADDVGYDAAGDDSIPF